MAKKVRPGAHHRTGELSRRDFLRAGAGLQLGLFLVAGRPEQVVIRALGPFLAPVPPSPPDAEPLELVDLGLYVRVDSDNTVTVVIPRPDMGQGPRTSLAMHVAEELEADWSKVKYEQAPADPRFGNQTSGGSTSTRNFWTPMRQAGAAARLMLIAAAAKRWGVDPATCRARASEVWHEPTGRRFTYGELAAAAAREPVPDNPPLKQPGQFTLIGRPTRRLDAPLMVRGEAIYGLDVRLPNLKVVAIARPVPFGGRAVSFDDAAARRVPGVRDVFRFGSGVAVVADHAWAALRGREELRVRWDPGPNAGIDDAEIRRRLRAAIGELPDLPSDVAVRVEAEYELPYLAHATMEPMNCTARVSGSRCEIWTPTQAPGSVQSAVASALGIPAANVTVHVLFTGGGFGRRLQTDYATEAALLSRQIGAPVQVIWSRDDDMRHDYYRPASIHRLRGGLASDGRPVAWHERVAMATQGRGGLQLLERGVEEPSLFQNRPPYAIPNTTVEATNVGLPLPTGPWRSVENTQYVFANESFIDELAAAAGLDPYRFRRGLIRDPRLRAVLDLAAEKAGWDRPPPDGVGRGIACTNCFGSWVADVAEVTVSPQGLVRVLRVVCAVDCGICVNPLGVEAQMEGAIADGVATCLKAKISVRDGGVVESSFADYRWLRFDEMPEVEVHIVPSTQNPGGIGEPGFPAVSPAITNAIFALTGRRIRRLPVDPAELAGWRPADTPTPTATPVPTAKPTTPATPGVPEHPVYLPWASRD